jgi:fermentation-respiration switch protein FrsA (DUF1100 family)
MKRLRVLLTAAFAVLLLYLSFLALVFFTQRSFIFAGTGLKASRELPLPPRAERLALTVDGKIVEALYLPAHRSPEGNAKRPAVIYAHGNYELIGQRLDELRAYTDAGMDLLLVEYPGYGSSEGEPSQESLTRAFAAGYDRLAARPGVDRGRIIGHGFSLGGGVVCALSRVRPLRALILQSSFIGGHYFTRRMLLPDFILRDPFDNLSAVAAFRGPVLILHGARDDIVPPENAGALHRASPGSRMVMLECGHNDCAADARLWPEILRFLGEKELL